MSRSRGTSTLRVAATGALPTLALRVALSWYLLVLLARESDEAAAVGAIVAAGS